MTTVTRLLMFCCQEQNDSLVLIVNYRQVEHVSRLRGKDSQVDYLVLKQNLKLIEPKQNKHSCHGCFFGIKYLIPQTIT